MTATTIRVQPTHRLTIDVIGAMSERHAFYCGGGRFHLPKGGRAYREGVYDATLTTPVEWLTSHGFTEEPSDDDELVFRAPGPSRVGVLEGAAKPAEACAECGGSRLAACRSCDGRGKHATGTCDVRCSACQGSGRSETACTACALTEAA